MFVKFWNFENPMCIFNKMFLNAKKRSRFILVYFHHVDAHKNYTFLKYSRDTSTYLLCRTFIVELDLRAVSCCSHYHTLKTMTSRQL